MPIFRLPRWIEAQYQTSIFDLMRSVIPKEGVTTEEWVNRLASVRQQTDILEIAAKVAQRMVINVNTQNVKTWREAAHRSSQSQKLYRLLQQEIQGGVGVRFNQIIAENARLISSVPADVAESLAAEIAKAQQQGVRATTIAKAMRLRFPELMTSRVQLIARTQAAMASSMLTQSRAEDLNLRWLEWDTSSDQRVRPSHRAMNGVLLTWNDPPSPEALIGIKSSLGAYLPGQAPNCRCCPSVLLSADDVSWPRKVYQAGAIHQMTRAKFQQLTGVPDRLAA